jgi:hypothetical protein
VSYETRLKAKVSGLVPICETFHELCSNAEGMFPTVAFDFLKQLETHHDSAKIRRLIDSANYQVSEGPRWFADPENLIVDFDWRFQKDTAERLFGMLARFGRVACIGAPTVFSLLSKVRRTDILIDQNPYYEHAFGREAGRVFCSAIEDFNPFDVGGQFEAALLDPPWSLADYESWLEATLPLIVKGGSLFIPVFPSLLRERAELDVSSLMQRLAKIGQVLFLPFRVRYETPTFEEEVLREKDLPPLHGWRSARMVEVRVDQSFRPTAKRRLAKEKWDRFEFGSTLVAVKSGHSAYIQSSEGRFFFLDSVSSRDESRPLITAVSSRNIATDFQDTSLLSEILLSIATRTKMTDDVDPLIVAARDLGASYG